MTGKWLDRQVTWQANKWQASEMTGKWHDRQVTCTWERCNLYDYRRQQQHFFWILIGRSGRAHLMRSWRVGGTSSSSLCLIRRSPFKKNDSLRGYFKNNVRMRSQKKLKKQRRLQHQRKIVGDIQTIPAKDMQYRRRKGWWGGGAGRVSRGGELLPTDAAESSLSADWRSERDIERDESRRKYYLKITVSK